MKQALNILGFSVVAAVALGALGCASPVAETEGEDLVSPASAAPAAAAGSCTDLGSPGDASSLELADPESPAPAAAGGAVTDGTYALTGLRLFGSAGRIRGPAAAVLKLRGGQFELVVREGTDERRFAGSTRFDGTAFTLRLACRSAEDAAVLHPRGSYASAPGELHLYEDFRAARVEYVYTRMM